MLRTSAVCAEPFDGVYRERSRRAQDKVREASLSWLVDEIPFDCAQDRLCSLRSLLRNLLLWRLPHGDESTVLRSNAP
jgi:hypothetical protein